MPTVAIVSQKGGSGKTTLALHLATCAAYSGRQACIVDTDPQATAAAWGDWRGDFLPEVVTCPPVRIVSTIQRVTRAGAEFVVIDTPPLGDSSAREAVRAADLVLIPARPRAFDLHATEATAELVNFVRKPAFVVLNAVPARATRLIDETTRFVEKLGLKVCPVRFGERAAFHKSSASGEVASEAEPEGKAAGEVDALWKWTRKQLGMPAKG
ncbi:cobyrinic acid a,c-diamide synthase [Novosphingobium marinum]|uniref:Chromosome partitioning protein n=1 Tax=Novosphingobium marinum TaxID=1514948 RepID=A0A7Y9XW15_9SPHN|nr:ParA family partition ATPase [Novosphingobium marinum]NYH94141.1 chromosome partitioning protein [Novosphingobium marinum]GGC19902.1 cobyrinic acid a,c-diamide synthase [Novosphingobium marinum]